MSQCKTVPKILSEYNEKAKEYEQSGEILRSLYESKEVNSFPDEIRFMEESIAALDQDMKAHKEKVDLFLSKIENDNRAWICANLHYVCGYDWETVSYLIGNEKSVAAIKVCVYRAFQKAQEEKASQRDAQLSVEN